MTTLAELALLNVATSWYIVGVVTMIEIHTYPSLAWLKNVSEGAWQQAHGQHCTAMGIIIGGPMVLQLITSIAWWWLAAPHPALLTCAILVALTWLLTFAFAVPQHNQLSKGFDDQALTRLRRTNRWRWLVWVVHAVWVSFIFLGIGK